MRGEDFSKVGDADPEQRIDGGFDNSWLMRDKAGYGLPTLTALIERGGPLLETVPLRTLILAINTKAKWGSNYPKQELEATKVAFQRGADVEPQLLRYIGRYGRGRSYDMGEGINFMQHYVLREGDRQIRRTGADLMLEAVGFALLNGANKGAVQNELAETALVHIDRFNETYSKPLQKDHLAREPSAYDKKERARAISACKEGVTRVVTTLIKTGADVANDPSYAELREHVAQIGDLDGNGNSHDLRLGLQAIIAGSKGVSAGTTEPIAGQETGTAMEQRIKGIVREGPQREGPKLGSGHRE